MQADRQTYSGVRHADMLIAIVRTHIVGKTIAHVVLGLYLVLDFKRRL